MSDVKRKNASASYDAVTRQRSGDMRSKQIPFRHFCNYVKKKLIQYVLDEISVTQSKSHDIHQDNRVNDIGNMISCAKCEKYGVCVLDLASGRGGDIGKWMYMRSSQHSMHEVQKAIKRTKNDPIAQQDQIKGNRNNNNYNSNNRLSKCQQSVQNAGIVAQMSHYECYDVSPQCISEARRRFDVMHTSEMCCTASFTVADCFSANFLQHELPRSSCFGKFDVVSIQFALHYACHSVDSVKRLIRTIARALKPNGYFIATTVHPHSLSQRVLSHALSNSIYEITFISPPQFTNPYNVNNIIDNHCEHHSEKDIHEENVCVKETALPNSVEKANNQLKPCTPYHFKLQGFVDCCQYVVPLAQLVRYAEEGEQDWALHECTSMSRSFDFFLKTYEGDWKSNKGNKLSQDEKDLVTVYTALCFVKV